MRAMRWVRGAVAFVIGLAAAVMMVRTGGDETVNGLRPPDPPAAAGPVAFSVFSYNIQTRPWFDDADEKLPKISALLDGYDVIAIQECFRKHELLWGQADYPNKVYFGSLVRPWKLANSGLSMLSRLPMAGTAMEHFRDVGELQNRVASKGIMMMRLMAGGMPLDVYNTHMEAGDRPEAQAARPGQARQAVDFVNAHSPPDHSVILTGDFNVMPLRAGRAAADYNPKHFSDETDLAHRTAAFQIMKDGLGLRDAQDELFGPTIDDIERVLFRPGTGHEMTPLECVRDGTTFRRPDGSALSDGSPLIVRFRLAPKP